MAAHGVTREQLAEKRHDARFAALMREMVAVVRRRYDDAAPGTALLAPESRDCVRAATALYGGILARDRAGRLPGARPPGVGVEAAPPGGVRPAVDRRPAGQGQGDHREAEEQVLDRRVGDPRAPDRGGVVGDDVAGR